MFAFVFDLTSNSDGDSQFAFLVPGGLASNMDTFCQEKVIHPEARKTVISIRRPPDTRHRHLPCPASSVSLPPFQPYKKQPSISNRILMNSGSILGACWIHVRFIFSSNFQQTRESDEYIPIRYIYIYLYIYIYIFIHTAWKATSNSMSRPSKPKKKNELHCSTVHGICIYFVLFLAPQIHPRPSQNQPRQLQRASKTPKNSQELSKTSPEAPQDRPWTDFRCFSSETDSPSTFF